VKRHRWLWGLLLIVPALLLLWMSCGPARVARVTQPSPELQAAARKAQETLDLFVGELREPRPGQRFFVRAMFPTPRGSEYLWLRDVEYRGGAFVGTLDQTPIFAEIARGDRVEVPRERVFDWAIREGDATRGAFTEGAVGN
jgi:uncharacterized protein YegJ (DUF2314 family)